MFTNPLSRYINSSMPLDQKYHSLPLYSHSKTNKKYQTPNKSLLTTTNTHNITLSMYSLKSKSKYQEPPRPTTASYKPIQPTANRGKSEMSKKMSSKMKVKVSKVKTKKLSKGNKKKIAKKIVEETKKEEVLQTNKEFFKHIRESVDCQSTSAFLSKISDIFDLVSLSSELPIEVQSFLARPLLVLRAKLRKTGKTQISSTLTEFKNNCMDIFRTAPGCEVALFLRAKLPSSNRWTPVNSSSRFRKEQQIQSRENYYQSLRKKNASIQRVDNAAFDRIESRLDEFLERSLKYRKVYI